MNPIHTQTLKFVMECGSVDNNHIYENCLRYPLTIIDFTNEMQPSLPTLIKLSMIISIILFLDYVGCNTKIHISLNSITITKFLNMGVKKQDVGNVGYPSWY